VQKVESSSSAPSEPGITLPASISGKGTPWIFLGLIALAAILAPTVLGRYGMTIGITLLYSAYLASAWNVVAGYAGQLSLAHGAFFGVGAYASVYFNTQWGISPWIGMVFGALISGAIAAGLGAVSFRYKLTGAYFAIATLAFAEILRVLINSSQYLGQGSGLVINLQEPGWWIMQFNDPKYFYFIFLTMMIGILFVLRWLSRSQFGYRLAAIRESEIVAESLGINPRREKLLAFVLSAILVAPAGSVYSQFLLFVDPPTFLGLTVAVAIILPALVGGTGTILGPLIGAVVLVGVTELLSHFALRPGISLFAYGVILILSVLLMPRGIWPTVHDAWVRLRAKQ